MNAKKVGLRFIGLILLLIIFGVSYILLTVNRELPIKTNSVTIGNRDFVIQNTVATISNNVDEEVINIEKESQISLNNISKVSTQITLNDDNTSLQNKVITFNSLGGNKEAVDQIEAQPDIEKNFKDGLTYYRSKESPSTFYFFPDDQTLVITEDINIIKPKSELSSDENESVLNSNGIAFSLNKDDAEMEHFTNNLPEVLVDRFQGINGKISDDENASYLEIKMESAFYARALEMALPKVLNQLKSKIIKVDGKFVVSGQNVTLSQFEMEMIRDINEKIDIKSGGKSVFLFLNEKEDANYMLRVIRNVILNE